MRCHSNSSSNEADEESSLSSLNSNHHLAKADETSTAIYMSPSLSLTCTSMSTFKTINANPIPAKASDIKKRANHRKQIYAALNSNNNNNNNSPIIAENEISSLLPPPPPPPLPPPLPASFDASKLAKPTSDFQSQIESAKTRLKKVPSEPPSPSGKFTVSLEGFEAA